VVMFLFQATVVAHPDCADELAAVLAPLAEASRSDLGCIHFSVGRDVENPSVFRTLELWKASRMKQLTARPRTSSKRDDSDARAASQRRAR
jgi:quinol monooxygenase YgiN